MKAPNIMDKLIVNNKEYYTNITDSLRLQKCKDFFSDGCVSYAISFDNNTANKTHEVKLKNRMVVHLREINFNQCFIPRIAKKFKTSESILRNGLDLIELL